MKKNIIKNLKSLSILLCGLIACVCMAAVCYTAPKAFAQAKTVNELTTFTTEVGASIRLDDPTGIRFTASISAEEYNALVEKYGEDGFELGMAIARVGSVDALKALDTTKTHFKMTNWDKDYNASMATATYKYVFAVATIAQSNYNVQYTALAYAKAGDTIAYSTYIDGETTRTPLQVATTYLASGEDDDYAKTIVDTVMATDAEFKLDQEIYSTPFGGEFAPTATVNGIKVAPVYSVADPTVAKIENGKVIGLKKGSTTVTATISGKDQDYVATASVEFTAKEVTPVLENGMLALGTEGEETTISIYAAADTEFATQLTSITTSDKAYDIRSLIISYMEATNMTTYGEYGFVATVESANYVGTYTTEEFVPVGNETIGAGYGTRFGYIVAKTHNSAETATGHYFFLTEDIDVTASAAINTSGFNQTNIAIYAFISLDGRGHTLSYTHVHSSTSGYTGLFGYLGASNKDYNISWKNVHVQANITLEAGANHHSLFACEVYSADFANCYFEMNVTNKTSKDTCVADFGWGSTLTNCVFEINNSVASTAGVTLNGPTKLGNQIVTDIAVIDANNDAVISGYVDENHIITNAYGYNTLADFIAGNNGKVANSVIEGNVRVVKTDDVTNGTICYSDWADWEITSTDVKLLGNTVRTTLKTEVTPTLTNGMLALGTKGEETTVSVYASSDTAFETALVTDTVGGGSTYDIREAIISYMEENVTTTGAYTYNVVVNSRNYEGVYASETFTPITSASEFAELLPKAYNTAAGVKTAYYYLANSIDISAYANRNNAHSFNQVNVGMNLEFNLDGRGNTISNTYTHTNTTASYYGIAGYVGKGNSDVNEWKNVHYKANITANAGSSMRSYVFGSVSNFTFTDCYFEVNVTNNSTGETGLFKLDSTASLNNCIIELNNLGTTDASVVGHGDGATSGYYYNCAIIDENVSSTQVVTTIKNGKAEAKPVYGYTTMADFVAGNNGLKGEGGNGSIVSAVANGTKCYTGWDSAWEISATQIKLNGKVIKTLA